MNIIEVIPIAKGMGMDSLSYFTSKETPVGAIVDIPVRKKILHGFVISTRKAEDIKSEVKSAPYPLKKLDKIKSTQFFSKEFIDTAIKTAEYYATSIGSVLDILVPEYILKNINKLKIQKNTNKKVVGKEKDEKKKEGTKILNTIDNKFVVQGDDEERYGTWKSLIRQEFAKKRSVFFILPTVEEAEYTFSILEKGIEGYIFILHGSLPPKKIIETWNKIMKESHPIVVVATGAFLSIERNDIETIVIEKEKSSAYKIIRRPFLDIRHVAEILAEKKGIKIFFADSFLRLETLHRESQGEILEATPFKFRSLSTARDTLVDMRSTKNENRDSFKIISKEVEDLITSTRDASEHMVILALRRGMAPSIVCGDCQNIVTCSTCSAPVVLHKSKMKEAGFFLCHRCGERRSTEEYCKICGSWKLATIGIGIDIVEEKIKDKFPNISIFRIDGDTVNSDKAARNIIQKYKEEPGSILIGTEMMLQYIHDKVESSAIISLDSLFSLPDFRIQEKILSILTRMRTLTSRSFVVQTRKSEEKVFEYGLKGNMSDFYKQALEERKTFNYPPFFILIKITLEGKRENIVKEMEEAQTILEPYEVEVFPAFTHTIKGNLILHGLIRIEKSKWVDKNLVEKLRNLSLSITVKVDPETLL